MHAISSYRGNRPTHTQTHTQTNPQTGPITIHCAAKLSGIGRDSDSRPVSHCANMPSRLSISWKESVLHGDWKGKIALDNITLWARPRRRWYLRLFVVDSAPTTIDIDTDIDPCTHGQLWNCSLSFEHILWHTATCSERSCTSSHWHHGRKFDRGLSQLLHADLHWLDVSERVLYKLVLTVHRCL